ncbi:hypothetical protein H311_03489 [Anncaliia algerae PRA109]|nr:hypothetical protein H311_03489 [Anncaliia algerae PRA109]
MQKEEKKVLSKPKKLRACLSCSLLKSSTSFRNSGCENCPFLNMKRNLSEYTSDNYKGIIFINDSNKSWVAKWQRIKGYVNGRYAIIVYGSLPEGVVEMMEDEGREYYARDKPFSIR